MSDRDRQRLQSLRSRSTKRLLTELARKAGHLAEQSESTVHWRYAKRARSGHGREYATYHSEKSGSSNVGSIDSQMLKAFSSALGKRNPVLSGDEVLETLWRRIKHRVCEEWDLCAKFKPSDPNFYMAVYAIARRGQPLEMVDLYAIVVALALRYGPDWMCGCSKR